jgi:hypothetical protein
MKDEDPEGSFAPDVISQDSNVTQTLLSFAGAENCASLLHSAGNCGDRHGVFEVTNKEILATYKGDGAWLPWQNQEIVIAECSGDVCLHHNMRSNAL